LSKHHERHGNRLADMNKNEITGLAQKVLRQLFVLLQYLLPHHLLSQVMYWITRSEWKPFKNLLIRNAVHLYKVDMSVAVEQDPEKYKSFNEFFTRALRPEARPLAEEKDAVICPVDGMVSEAGNIEDGRIYQAKGHDFTLQELLGGDPKLTSAFADGSFATIYLSPRDYHRIHIPLGGTLKKMVHVPGRLFSVSPTTTRAIPRLFARNERIINLFDTDAGPMAVIMVGAIFVASMDTVWAGTVTPRRRQVQSCEYGRKSTAAIKLGRGAELGRFNMGSTVILLFGKEAVQWEEILQPETKVQMGQQIATIKSES
jgi:phosphatidylserine decarboxylase